MKIYRLVLAACTASMLAAQTASIAGPISARLTANDLRADVSFLASDALEGRGTPSPGLDIAAEFIASQFRRAGLEAAGDDGYFQTAALNQVTRNTDGLELTLEVGGRTIKGTSGMTLMQAAALDLSHAPAVKMAADEVLTPEQVRGKVLVLESAAGGRRPRIPAAEIARLQPALVVVLAAAPLGQMNSRPRLEEAPGVPMLAVWDGAIRTALADARPGPLEAAFSVKIPPPLSTPVKLRNVIGILRGSAPALRDTYVVVSAHYDHLGVMGTGEGDHIFNGANDDASGTASMIEIANALAPLPSRPKRTIVFLAVFGEELGLLGSRYYARHPVFPLARTVADINLEQMGRTDDTSGTHVGMVNVTGFDYTTLTSELQKAGAETGIQVVKDEKNSDPFYAASDNQAFADAGVPSHTLSVSYIFPDYHKAGDEWFKIDYENMAKVDRAVALAVFRIADSAEAPQWNTANPKTARYAKARQSAGQPAGLPLERARP